MQANIAYYKINENQKNKEVNMLLSDQLGNLGTESAFSVLARAEQLAQAGREIINLGIGQADFRTPEHIINAAIKAMQDGHHGYTNAQGILPLRQAVATYYKNIYNATINPKNILIVPGGKVTMYLAITMFGGAGHEIIYPDPGFPIYRSVIQFTGAKAVDLPILEENNFAFNADDVLSRITPQTSLIILNSPANPTGGLTPRAEIIKLVKGLAKHKHVVLLMDEIYSRLTYDGAEHYSILNHPEIYDQLILLDGWSKTYSMTGWRLGLSVWPEQLIDQATRLCVNIHSCVNAPTQYAGIAAFLDGQECVDEMVAILDQRRKIIVKGLNNLPNISCITPKGSFFAFANIKKLQAKYGGTALEWQGRFLEEAGVATIAGTSFGIHGEGYIRFSFAAATQNIGRGLQMLHDYLSKNYP